MLHAGTFVAMMFKAISYTMSRATLEKIQIVSETSCEMLHELVAPEQLEEKHGGTAPNRKDGEYWPPRLPSDHFDNENAVSRSSVSAGNAPS